MNFDDLIPFIIFLGIIVFNILKRFGKKKQETQDSKPLKKPAGKMAFGLSKLVGTIKAELELAGLEPKQKEEKAKVLAREVESGGDEFAEAEPGTVGFEEDDLDDGLKEIIREEISKPLQPSDVDNEQIEQAHIPEKQKTPKTSDMVWGVKKKKCRKVPTLSVSKMREAIVLSEIIAKPIALRD